MSCVITVAQQKGGVGKTSLVAHLSAIWSHPPKIEGRVLPPIKTIALDADPQQSLSEWFERREENENNLGDLTVRSALGWRLSSELANARREADLVLLDLPPGTDKPTQTGIRAADLVVIPMQLSPMDLWATGPTVDLAVESSSDFIVVFNRVPPRTRLNDQVVNSARSEEWPLARTMLGNRTLFASSLLDGLGVSEYAPTSVAAAELRLLSSEIRSTVGRLPQAA